MKFFEIGAEVHPCRSSIARVEMSPTSTTIFVVNNDVVNKDKSPNCSSWTRPEEKQFRSAKIDFLGFKSFLVGTQFIVAQSQSSILRDQTLSDF